MFSVSPEIYSVLSDASRWLFAFFALMLLLDRIKGGHKIVSRLELEGTLMIRESCRPFSEMTEPEYYI